MMICFIIYGSYWGGWVCVVGGGGWGVGGGGGEVEIGGKGVVPY